MAGIGDNSSALSADEQQGLFFHHLDACAAARAKTKAAREDERRLRKLAKADGIKLRNLDFALRINDTDNEAIVVDELAAMQRIAAWMGLPVGTQADLGLDREPAVDRAEREGAAAGRKGRDRDAPYEIDTEAAQAWLKAYDRARAGQLEAVASALDKIKADRKGDEKLAATVQ
jgi:hypothetical protein